MTTPDTPEPTPEVDAAFQTADLAETLTRDALDALNKFFGVNIPPAERDDIVRNARIEAAKLAMADHPYDGAPE